MSRSQIQIFGMVHICAFLHWNFDCPLVFTFLLTSTFRIEERTSTYNFWACTRKPRYNGFLLIEKSRKIVLRSCPYLNKWLAIELTCDTIVAAASAIVSWATANFDVWVPNGPNFRHLVFSELFQKTGSHLKNVTLSSYQLKQLNWKLFPSVVQRATD